MFQQGNQKNKTMNSNSWTNAFFSSTALYDTNSRKKQNNFNIFKFNSLVNGMKECRAWDVCTHGETRRIVVFFSFFFFWVKYKKGLEKTCMVDEFTIFLRFWVKCFIDTVVIEAFQENKVFVSKMNNQNIFFCFLPRELNKGYWSIIIS